MLDPNSIEVVDPSPNSINQYPKVQVDYKSPYDKEYAKFTEKNVGEQVAILLDDEIELVVTIKDKITKSGVISGKYTYKEAQNLAILLKSGSLPVSLNIESLSEIGPTLGEEVKEKGLLAVLLSFTMFLLLLIIAYSNRVWLMLNGMISLLLLAFNIILIIAAFHLTIDFAAIAGFMLALAIGMDAFIIIFEALIPKLNRAESKKSLLSHFEMVVQEIYSLKREGRILFHSIISTLLVIFLLTFTDRVKFFALAMLAGLLASFLTILFTQKILASTQNLAKYSGFSIFSYFRGINTKIFNIRKFYLFISVIAIVVAIGLLLTSFTSFNYLKLGSDFKAGTQIVINTKNKKNIEEFFSEFKNKYPSINIKKQSIKGSSKKQLKHLITIDESIKYSTDSISNEKNNRQINEFGESESSKKELVNNNKNQKNNEINVMKLNNLHDLLKKNELKVLSINSIDSKLSSNRFFTSLSVILLSFLLLGLYLFGFQKPIDNFFLRNVDNIEAKTHSHGWSIIGIFLALLHDISFMLIACSILNIEIDLTVIAAFITIIGYSVNDSIVLWGQIQNIANKQETIKNPTQIVSDSINSILSRSILTSISTIIPALAIFLLDITELESFAILIVIGTLFGTLSSIFIVGRFALKTLTPKKSEEPIDEDKDLSDQDINDLFNDN